MRIVVDTALNEGESEYSNLGDIAMLQVAVSRLRQMWPSASIEVLTGDPAKLELFCPGTKALPRSGREFWVRDNAIVGQLTKSLPRRVASISARLSRAFRLRSPAGFKWLAGVRLMIRDRENVKTQVDGFVKGLAEADLFMVCGAGGFSDDTRIWNLLTLNTVEEAVQRGIPVVMMGQAMGPLSDVFVRARARSILPKVRLLTLRGSLDGAKIGESLGLNASQMRTTGDEAVELAYAAGVDAPGNAIGVNLRMASYSKISQEMAAIVKTVLHKFARRHQVRLLPIPIAFHSWAKDHLVIQQLLQGLDDDSDGGITLDTPLKVIKQIGRCRIVVTGAYHAAVFALSQGIPIVGLSASTDYRTKFCGLEEQFGLGCETVHLDQDNFAERLTAAMERGWESAGQVRLGLREAARRQIEQSWLAYNRVQEIVSLHGESERTGGDRLLTNFSLESKAEI